MRFRELVERMGIERLQLGRLAESGNRLPVLTARAVDHAHAEPRAIERRLEIRRAPEASQRIVVFRLLLVHVAEVEPDVRIIRFDREGPVERGDGLIVTLVTRMEKTQTCRRQRETGIRAQCFVVFVNGALGAAQGEMEACEVVVQPVPRDHRAR